MELEEQYQELTTFLIAEFADREGDIEDELEETHVIVNQFIDEAFKQYDFAPLMDEMENLLHHDPFPIKYLTKTANMYFEDTQEAKEWLREVINIFKKNQSS
ncbi:hypothetical protein IQ249_15095 [Lusitaniella coriacea LEGE 07157]|uniref:CdiI immunity protein domain-containing protein n=1 Tax=Lusitaniella coriacea LEGE 07157 TaxID=945747 RepID=A0A8J7JC61_9CYAN|nr:hypothetical protein [Lusitaniella coriacea]MBE9117225.1 hypothetical protein [Lusitaniella coriacea LEGE 07157]